MSELQIGVVAEGPSDIYVIENLLKKFLKRPFLLDKLQPQGSLAFGETGAGWPGVYRWCKQITTTGDNLEKHTLLAKYQMLIVHIDADVAKKTYASANILSPSHPTDLPCACECPPANACADALMPVIAGWLNQREKVFPSHWLFCIPAQTLEAWSIAAVYGETPERLPSTLECLPDLAAWISSLPVTERRRLKKNSLNYRDTLGPLIAEKWEIVSRHCIQAQRFQSQFQAQT